jgi:GST-like protein
VIPIDLGAKANRSSEYLDLNPSGQTPTLVDSEGAQGKPLILRQSGAIVLYACRKANRHIPPHPVDYAAALQWFMQASSDIAGTSAALNQMENVTAEKIPAHIKLFRDRFIRYFNDIERHLQSNTYLAREVSFADFMLYPNYALRTDLLDANTFPALTAWGKRMSSRPSVQAGMKLYTDARGQ